MKEHDIHRALDIAKHNELQNLQWKVGYLRNEINVLEFEKSKASNQILKLNMTIDELEFSLAQKRGQMAYMNQGTGFYNNNNNNNPSYPPLPYSWYDNNIDNLYSAPIPHPDSRPYNTKSSYSSIQLSHIEYLPEMLEANRIYAEAMIHSPFAIGPDRQMDR
jgi:hypothetical protein